MLPVPWLVSCKYSISAGLKSLSTGYYIKHCSVSRLNLKSARTKMQKYVGQLHYGIWYFEVRTGTKFSLYDCWTSTRFQYRTNGSIIVPRYAVMRYLTVVHTGVQTTATTYSTKFSTGTGCSWLHIQNSVPVVKGDSFRETSHNSVASAAVANQPPATAPTAVR